MIPSPSDNEPGGQAGARHRPRRPVLAADRPARARVPRLLGARRSHDLARGGARAQPARADPQRRAGVGVRGQRAARRPADLRARHPDARHLLRHAADGARPRRSRRPHRRLRVREDGAARGGVAALQGHAGGSDRLDVAPRLGRRAARGRARRRRLAVDADRGVRGARAPPLRRPVPSRGRAHAARDGGAEELPLRDRRRAAGLDARGRDRGAGRAHPRAGRVGARALRALRRRRLGRRGAARAQGGRRPAHLRLRRPRDAAQGRGRAGRRDLRRALPRAARPRAGAGALPRSARRRRGAGAEAEDHRRASSSASSRRKRGSSATSSGSSRGRSTAT